LATDDLVWFPTHRRFFCGSGSNRRPR
jgi:hypothetical protein